MKLRDFLDANFNEEVTEWCFEGHDLDRELNDGDDLVFEVTNVDRDGFNAMAREHLSPVERLHYWLDSEGDSNGYIDELFRVEQVVIVSSVTVGPYTDEEADAFGTFRVIVCPDAQRSEEKLAELRHIARINVVKVLSEPLVYHRNLLGDASETARALMDIIEDVMARDRLQDQFVILNELTETLVRSRLQAARNCFGAILHGPALEYRSEAGSLKITAADGTHHDLEEILASVDQYSALSETLGAPPTAVDASTLRIASQVLAATL